MESLGCATFDSVFDLQSKGGVLFLILLCCALDGISLSAAPDRSSNSAYWVVIVDLLLAKHFRNFD